MGGEARNQPFPEVFPMTTAQALVVVVIAFVAVDVLILICNFLDRKRWR
jgi:hypothetical protein